MIKKYTFITSFIILTSFPVLGQEEFSLLEQFNGRYDFTFIGNTMNYAENGIGVPCIIQTSTSAQLNISTENQIERAYLYWSGSGLGDFNIKLNDIDIEPDRNYSLNYISSNRSLDFFVAVTDITQQILDTGNGTYTVSEFDVSDNFILLEPYCNTSTNYAGWAIVIVYKNDNLPLNQLNIYEGFKNVPDELNIVLDNLNVIDNEGAQIGFVAWEGDSGISVNETLRINGNIMSNPPLNPANNAFNGTNSFTGASNLYNMDLDVYDIQDNIQIGDNSATVQLTSGQDLVIISTVVTKLNSQLPDATIEIDEVISYCNSDEIEIFYTVYNMNATDILPAHTPVSIYVNDEFIALTFTQNDIAIDEFENGNILLSFSEEITDIEVFMIVDEQNSIVEIIETNNTSNIIHIEREENFPQFNPLDNLLSCNTGNNIAVFDFSEYEYLVKQNESDTVSFYNSEEEANQQINPIFNLFSYTTSVFPKEIFVRIDNENCYSITSFLLNIRNCPPVIYNGISANNDGVNDEFNIEGLYDIFEDFELYIYSRWGVLIWKGNNTTPRWNGKVTEKNAIYSQNAPEGTYFYILYLNDKNYPSPFQGYLYLTK